MPVTNAVVGHHSCRPPGVEEMVSAGYLPDTEWTCSVCGVIHTLANVHGPLPIWVQSMAMPVPEPVAPEQSS